jgi:hypothetical protein
LNNTEAIAGAGTTAADNLATAIAGVEHVAAAEPGHPLQQPGLSTTKLGPTQKPLQASDGWFENLTTAITASARQQRPGFSYH